jgi:leader peptidase (prepilin peptidase) / N-methyltransferase
MDSSPVHDQGSVQEREAPILHDYPFLHVHDWVAVGIGTALAFVLLGPNSQSLTGFFAALWWVAVVAIVRSDLERFIIPDWASFSIATLGVIHATIDAAQSPLGEGMPRMIGALLTGLAGFGLFWVVRRIYRRARGRDGLGFGDVKLAGASALWLGPTDAAFALEIAALAALAVLLLNLGRDCRIRDRAAPFGAFLAPAAWLTYVVGPTIKPLLDVLP